MHTQPGKPDLSFKKHPDTWKQLGLYSLCLAGLLFLLKWLHWKFFIVQHSVDVYISLIAILFTALGIWAAQQFAKPKVTVVEKEVLVTAPGRFEQNEAELKKLGLSPREWEVLQLMAKGMSNAEIAEGLFLSLSTIKTHASNLFVKMDVSSRAKAIEKAKRLRITP